MVGTDFVIHFTINDQEHESPEAQVSVAWLLAQAGLGTVDAEVVRRATGETWHDPNAAIELHDGDAFVAKAPDAGDRPIHYTVNGEPQVSTHPRLTVEEILRRAGRDAAIDPDKLDKYYLDNVQTGTRYEKPDDVVPLAEGDQFLALYAGETPVA